MWRSCNVSLMCVVSMCSAVTAVEPRGKLSAADIAQAIRGLGDDSFQVRERSSWLLRSAGRAAEPALVAARFSNGWRLRGFTGRAG
jgi:hypothetical protein